MQIVQVKHDSTYMYFVYTTQVNGTFRARWLARSAQ